MSLSCVVRCDKVPVAHSDVVYFYDYEYTLSDGSIAKCGDWIVRDVYDKYSVMTDEEYQPVGIQRQAWRHRINELEELIKG